MPILNDIFKNGYYYMYLSRRFDQVIAKKYKEGRIIESLHSHIGQEAIGVGTVLALEEKDVIVPSLRTRPALFTKGSTVREHFSGMMGKIGGPNLGVSHTHHMTDHSKGIIGTTGVLSSHLPVACGVALTAKLKSTGQVVLCYFGDGAANRGDVHEAFNLASIQKLPIIFICENNGFAESLRFEEYSPIESLSIRAMGYGMPGKTLNGNNFNEVYSSSKEAIMNARSGEGPTFLEFKTLRDAPHVEGFPDFRTAEEIGKSKEEDPINRLREYIIKETTISLEEIQQLELKVDLDIKESFEQAINDTELVPSKLDRMTYV